jgi:hypothetical protein
MTEALRIWVVYHNPADFPGKYVLRPQDVKPDGEIVRRPEVWLRDSLDELRRCIPPGLHQMPRFESDDPVIVETWF